MTCSQDFDHTAEAELYLKVARRRMGPEARLRSFTRQGRSHIELTASPVVRASVESAYLQALHDLQMAASTIRAEADRLRDEAIRQAQAAHARQCEQAFQAAVDSYTASAQDRNGDVST